VQKCVLNFHSEILIPTYYFPFSSKIELMPGCVNRLWMGSSEMMKSAEAGAVDQIIMLAIIYLMVIVLVIFALAEKVIRATCFVCIIIGTV